MDETRLLNSASHALSSVSELEIITRLNCARSGVFFLRRFCEVFDVVAVARAPSSWACLGVVEPDLETDGVAVLVTTLTFRMRICEPVAGIADDAECALFLSFFPLPSLEKRKERNQEIARRCKRQSDEGKPLMT